jgi:hypothetical protein
LSRTLAAATSTARTRPEFEQIQNALKATGSGSGTDLVFRRLSSSLPNWYISLASGAGADRQSATRNPTLEAMLQMMRLAENRPEAGKWYKEVVQTAIGQFNTGSLGKAVTMLELADSMVTEGNIDADVAARVRSSAHESLDFNRLRVCAEKPETHFLLKQFMNHFSELTPESLLGRLRIEPKRDRRRLILNLLETHGPVARLAAFQQLEDEAGAGDIARNWYFPRNLVCILNRVAPGEETDLDKEIALVGSFLKLSYPAPLVREAMTHLGQLHHGAEEPLLLKMLDDLERKLLETGVSDPESERLQSLLDRVTSVLSRYGTPGAYRAVVDHGLKRREEFGDTPARLACLAGEDLTGAEECVSRLLSALKARTPLKLLGIVIHKDVQDPLHLIKALSSTPAPEVRRAFEHIARNFPNQEFGRAASRALKGFASNTRPNDTPTEKLLGDLELLSLPDLLQQLARSRLTGMLTLKDQRGEAVGTVSVQTGLLTDCRTGLLEGRAAVYQLLLNPFSGTFVFMRRKGRAAGEQPDAPPGQDLAPLIQEATRRHDELQRARALVPDGCRLKTTGVEPRPRPDEEDPALFRRVWNRACSGASPSECEADSPGDAYQIRLLLARWIEDAVLVTQ